MEECNMNPVALVFLIIGASILGLCVLLDILIGFSMWHLSMILRKKTKNLMIILAQKYDLCVFLAKQMIDLGVEIPESLKAELNISTNPAMGFKNTTERFLIARQIKRIYMDLKMIYDASESAYNDPKCQTIVGSIQETDALRGKEVVSFNNFGMAYNYWIMFPIFRPLSKMFHIYKVKLLEN
jgi:hypothetical protein